MRRPGPIRVRPRHHPQGRSPRSRATQTATRRHDGAERSTRARIHDTDVDIAMVACSALAVHRNQEERICVENLKSRSQKSRSSFTIVMRTAPMATPLVQRSCA